MLSDAIPGKELTYAVNTNLPTINVVVIDHCV